MIGYALLALAALTTAYFVTRSASAAPLPNFIKIVTSEESGARYQTLDMDTHAAGTFAETESKYKFVSEKSAPATTLADGSKSSTKYELVGEYAPDGERLLSRQNALIGTRAARVLWRLDDIVAIVSGRPPKNVTVRVIVDPTLDDRALVLEGSPWVLTRTILK